MLRSRVRRSFTVEVKSKSRQTSSWPEDPAPSPVNWAALDPAPETPSPFETTWSDKPASTAPPIAADKPRRILPNLIVAEPEPEASDPVVEREARHPRVRRVKSPQVRSRLVQRQVFETTIVAETVSAKNEVRSDAAWSFADIHDEVPETPAPLRAPPEVSVVASVPPPARRLSKGWSAVPALAPGERWKRRLPRSCR